MSTDNSKVLRNKKNDRSMFGLNSSLRTSRNLGQISVHSLNFALPKDTIKKYEGFNVELKPTTDRIASKIFFNRMSVACPLRAIWHYADSFIGKGGDILKNGAFSVPYIQGAEQTTIKKLPCMRISHIIGYFLAAMGSHGSSQLYARNRQLYSLNPSFSFSTANVIPETGNVQDWSFDYITHKDGGKRLTYTAIPTSRSRHIWWEPKLVKGGIDETGINLNISNTYTSSANTSWAMHIPCPEVVALVNATKSAGLTDVYNEVCVTASYDNTTHKSYFLVGLGYNNDSYRAEMRTANKDNWHFSVDGITSGSTLRYGKITINNRKPYGGDHNIGKDEYFVYSDAQPAGATISGSHWVISNMFMTNLAVNALLNTPDLLGYGSLSEMLGVSFFKQTSLSEIYENFGQLDTWLCNPNRTYKYKSAEWRKLNFPFLVPDIYNDWENGGDDSTPINVLPFYAYQKIVSDRFLLGHNILTNSVGQDSSVDKTIQYDSPFYRNNMVPTKCYWRPLSANAVEFIDDNFLYVSDPTADSSSKMCRISDGADVSTLDPAIWHYTQHINQLMTIFCSRNALLEMDVFKKIWQRENMNVQSILNASNYQAVDTNRKLQAVALNLTRDLLRFVRFGGTDQLAKNVISNHFGVNDVPCDCSDVIVLHTDKSALETSDITNTGGGVDADGNPLALGEKVSVITNSIPKAYKYSAFVPDFAFIMDLDWLSCAQYRSQVPNFATNDLGNRISLADDFRLALFPDFQNTGDEPLTLGQVAFGLIPNYRNSQIGWTAKNNTLKDSDINEVSGEYQTLKYQRQCVGARPNWYCQTYAPSLTYGYLQPNSSEYNLPIIDRYGSHLLLGVDKTLYKKSCLTKSNPIGL